MVAVVYGAPYTMAGEFKWIDTLYTENLTAYIPATPGEAVYVRVQIDFDDESLEYAVGDPFDSSLSHTQVWAMDEGTGDFLPRTSRNAFRAGFVRLHYGATAITREMIFSLQEIYTKSDYRDILVAGGEVVTAGGYVVTI